MIFTKEKEIVRNGIFINSNFCLLKISTVTEMKRYCTQNYEKINKEISY